MNRQQRQQRKAGIRQTQKKQRQERVFDASLPDQPVLQKIQQALALNETQRGAIVVDREWNATFLPLSLFAGNEAETAKLIAAEVETYDLNTEFILFDERSEASTAWVIDRLELQRVLKV